MRRQPGTPGREGGLRQQGRGVVKLLLVYSVGSVTDEAGEVEAEAGTVLEAV